MQPKVSPQGRTVLRRGAAALTALLVLATGACSDGGEPEAASGKVAPETTTTVLAPPQGTAPTGPSLCDRLSDPDASAALGFDVHATGGATDASCVYVTTAPERAGTVLVLSRSDSGEDVEQLLDAARSGSSSFSSFEVAGQPAYVAVIDERPLAAFVKGGKQYTFSLVATPPLSPETAEAALTELVELIGADL